MTVGLVICAGLLSALVLTSDCRSTDYCTSTEAPYMTSLLTVADVPIIFNGGISSGHTFLVNACADKGTPSVTQLSSRSSVAEAVFVGTSRLVWNLSVGYAYATLACANPPLSMFLVLECSTVPGNATAVVSVDDRLAYKMTVNTIRGCIEVVGKTQGRVLTPVEIALSVVLLAAITFFAYSVTHRYCAQNLRGWQLIPGVSRRVYVALPKEEAEVEVN